ncbi:MAG TPA: protein kinase, partial [Candidatus Xenobia bacterium]
MGTVIGTVLKGRYQIEEKLGEGGVAEVFRAVDRRLGRTVVVKTLKRDLMDKPDVLERFSQEARDAASLSHPNIVQVFDAESEGHLHFIVMELCDGGDLRHLMDAGPLPIARILAVVHAMLNALAYAHEHGIVHRDIKPSNILLHGNAVKLGDFGIARALMSDTVTQQGTLIGSAGYLSPEQAQGFRVTASGDLYSLGVVLYELLTGRLPFESNNPIALALKHVQEPPPSPRAVRP